MGEHVWHRSVGVIDGHGIKGALGFMAAFPLYFLMFFVSFFPWSTRMPAALRRWWPERKNDELGWYLLTQALLVFFVFSCVRTKLPHYTMPAFPCLALWLARSLAAEGKAFVWFQKRLVAMAVFSFTLTLIGFPILSSQLLTENLWRQVQPHVRPETKIACLGYVEPSLVWKFRSVATNIVLLGDVKLAQDFLTNSPPFILVVPTKDLPTLPAMNGLRLQAQGLDTVKFKHWNLTAIVR
jgi:4-amino-4-deoxy-L-arabinose transferase-like glycosyltransferase